MNCTILQGDALELLRTLPPESVHTCVTSPPYYNLRDYGVEGQIGNEGSVEEYLQALVAVFREVRRVLHPNGTLWVNVGDYASCNHGFASHVLYWMDHLGLLTRDMPGKDTSAGGAV